jgi:hypothetical protein
MSCWVGASDSCLANTADWTAKQMMKMGWDERNRLFERLATRNPRRFLELLRGKFSPDDLLAGTATGRSPSAVVVLPNKRKRQARLEEFFVERAAM